MELKEAIEEAKKLARTNYENRMKKYKVFDPSYKRDWYSVKRKDGGIAYAYRGTPDKCFVIVSDDKKSVAAFSQQKELLGTFEVD